MNTAANQDQGQAVPAYKANGAWIASCPYCQHANVIPIAGEQDPKYKPMAADPCGCFEKLREATPPSLSVSMIFLYTDPDLRKAFKADRTRRIRKAAKEAKKNGQQ